MTHTLGAAPESTRLDVSSRTSGLYRCTQWIVLPEGRQILADVEGAADPEAAVGWLVERGHATASAFEDVWANEADHVGTLRSRLMAEDFTQQALAALQAGHRFVLEISAPDSFTEFVLEAITAYRASPPHPNEKGSTMSDELAFARTEMTA
ncbi:hypothetical protein [Streptomyces candidus]|uniref:Uncharacterized protein n=1 Tax=Streptomyces candidus TaxID=67283 RepID=A0A7X0LSM3_9ACTN|nr:hypothetical protein [Streptomyces candidus]MBB6439410.1 hypothetical protein [Streptomyces candidus]